MIIISVGQRIKLARREAGLTQEKLAQMTNLSRSYIAAIEIDSQNPSLTTLQSIAEVLRVPVSVLIDEKFSTEVSNVHVTGDLLELMKGFNALDTKGRQRLIGYLDALLEMMKIKK